MPAAGAPLWSAAGIQPPSHTEVGADTSVVPTTFLTYTVALLVQYVQTVIGKLGISFVSMLQTVKCKERSHFSVVCDRLEVKTRQNF